ncbi:MAG: DUF4082 domain-containing protein, partial [Anaerolineales bacterium]
MAIPQADEQQRLLANLILQTNLDNMPLPRFWYFPRGEKAVVLFTSDDHASANVPGRMDQYKSLSPDGCSVEDWECVRSSMYIYPGTTLSEAQANSYTAEGFEIGVHIDTGCADYTLTGLEGLYNTQIDDFATRFPSLPLQDSERTHCIAWSGWAFQPIVKEQQGIRLDTNYYYWPPEWLNNRPGMFTGSGMPMRFADLDGTMIDVYQAATQMTDESDQTYPYTIDALLDKALGPQGYYGVFTANMHTSSVTSAGAYAIIASAQTRGVPLVSGRQLVNWLDGRNGSSFSNLTWSANTLNFEVQVGAGANGLQAMVPAQSAVGTVSGITIGGSPVAFTLQTIKGIQYAVFDAAAGAIVVSYTTDETPPLVNAVSPTVGAIDVPANTLVYATFSEPMDAASINTSTFELLAPGDILVPATVTYDAGTNTATLTPDAALDLNTSYTAFVKGGATGVSDIAGNPLAADETWSFTTAVDDCPCSIWDDTATPVSSAVDDGQPIEVGTKFRADSAGYITALRFYKGPGDTDTHVGHLWTSTGELFAEVTSSDETASGWQVVPLPTPVPIEADTTYIASIFSSPVGYFSITLDYFATSGVDNPPLWALAAGEDGPNGVFAYGGGFPTGGTDNGYWVDVVFEYSTEDTTPPVISNVVATPAPDGSAIITWDTDESADSLVEYGTDPGTLDQSAYDAAMVTSHSVTLPSLAPNTTYYYRVTSTDAASNSATEPVPPVTLQFTTPDLGFTDTTVGDFSNGESNTCYVAETGGGELMLSPTLGVEFSGTSLPAGWTDTPWTGGVGTTVNNRTATVDGALLATDAYYGAGRSIEFVATFTGGTTGGSQHIGFGTDLNNTPWAIFSTGFPGSTTLKARSNSSTTELPSVTLNEPHLFRIEWLANEVVFYVDGGEVARHTVSITASMRSVASDQPGGNTITIDWMRMSPYESLCTFESRVFDAATVVSWDSLSWIADVPADTSLSLSYRTGDTSTPDGTWTTFIPLSSSPAVLGGSSQ